MQIKLLSIVALAAFLVSAYNDVRYYDAKSHQNVTDHKAIIGLKKLLSQGQRISRGANVTVGMLDTVFDSNSDTSEALSKNTIVSPYESEQHEGEHGEGHANHVASIIAGKKYGIASSAQLHVCEVLDTHSYDDIANSIDRMIKAKVDFINVSFFVGSFSGAIPQKLLKAFLRAKKAGIGVIIAASNEGLACGSDNYTKSLAKLAQEMDGHMLIVASTNYKSNQETIAKLSNRAGIASEHVIAAPGEHILASGPAHKALVMGGTSMATPVVTACAAVLKSNFPHLTSKKVLSILMKSARKMSLNNKQLATKIYGHGVVDISAAYQEAKSQ
jgi:subtilisin family serine protease